MSPALSLLLLLVSARAEDRAAPAAPAIDTPAAPIEPAAEATPAAPEPAPMTPSQRVALARDRLRLGDLDGAALLLDQAEAGLTTDSDVAEAGYLRAWILEHRGQVGDARAAYDAVVAGFPVSAVAADARFRAAECTARLGDYKAARARLQALPPQAGADAVKVELIQWVWALEAKPGAGRRRKLAGALAAVPADQAPVTQARARLALMADTLAEATRFDLQVPEKKLTKQLERRAGLLKQAEGELITIVEGGQIEAALHGLARLGAGYESLGDDLLRAPVAGLTPDQQAIYDQEVRKKAEALWLRAHALYERGVDLALRTLWDGDELAMLQDKERAVMLKIEA